MIQVTVFRSRLIDGFRITGHADAGQYGHDIVCAAVSVLSITTINGIISVAGVQPQIQKDAVEGGFLTARVPQVKDARHNLKAQTLLASFVLGIKSIARDYSRYVKLKIIRS